MIEYENLLGRTYVGGKQDCYSIIRDFYLQNYQIDLPNYARPKDFWTHDANLYMDRYYKNGFRAIDVHPTEYQLGDVFLISIMSAIANHAGILVDNGKILHHFTNRQSTVETYRGIWKNNTVAILRHKDVVATEVLSTGNVLDYLPPNLRRKIDAELQSRDIPTETL